MPEATIGSALCLLISLAVPFNAFRKGSLDAGGSALACIFALITLYFCSTKVFAVSLLTFFFVGSRATKYKHSIKSKLEEPDHQAVSSTNKAVPPRDWKQVACNGLFGTFACVAWMVHSRYRLSDSCPIGSSALTRNNMLSTRLVYAAVGFWAACLGDTLASELGMLSRTKPVMITTLRTVAPGTNGGITVFGTFVSLLGGQLISLVAVACLYIETGSCRKILLDHNNGQLIRLLIVGQLGGLFGNLLDSLLGATLQQTLYDTERKMVVKMTHQDARRRKDVKIIDIGGLAVLSNNGVNLLASVVTGLLAVLMAG